MSDVIRRYPLSVVLWAAVLVAVFVLKWWVR